MQDILKNIQSGNFAKEFMNDCDSGGNKMNQFRRDSAEHSIESVGEELRSMMPWITANKIVDKTKS
jgi:ketol-acid reductoisomerase